MTPTNEDNQRWDSTFEAIDEIERTMNVALYGFDISKLSVKEQQFVIETARKRRELEAEAERRNPKPLPEMTEAERLEYRWNEAMWAKFEKVADGKSMKNVSNEELEEQLKIMRSIVERVERKGVK